jgi:hypothetical protein
MIPRKFTGEMLKGRKATLERDIRNVAGVAIGKGATPMEKKGSGAVHRRV